MPADHQQGDGDRHDPSVDAGSSQLAMPRGGPEDRRLDGEEREDDDGADQRAELRA